MVYKVSNSLVWIVGVVNYPDGINHIKDSSKAHLRYVRLDKFDICELRVSCGGNLNRVQIDSDYMLRKRRNKTGVLTAPAASFQHGLTPKVIELIWMNPVGEQEEFIVLEHLPLL